MPFIKEHVQWLSDQHKAGQDDLVLKLIAKQDEKRVLQLTNYTINAFYPYGDEPAKAMEILEIPVPKEIMIAQWEAGEFVNFAHDGRDPQPVGEFLSKYLPKVVGVDDDLQAWNVTVERFADR